MQRLDAIIASLSPKVLPPGWLGNYTPDGVLFHNGWAVQEMPAAEPQGGYTHALRHIKGKLDDFFPNGAYPLPLPPANPPLPANFEIAFQDMMEKVYRQYYELHYSAIFDHVNDYDDIFSKGSCVVLQSFVFAPERDRTLPTRPWRHYSYTEMDAIIGTHRSSALGDDGLYANIGVQNNPLFYDNSLEFKFNYAQQGFQGMLAKYTGATATPAQIAAFNAHQYLNTNITPPPPSGGSDETVPYTHKNPGIQHLREVEPPATSPPLTVVPVHLTPLLDVTRKDVVLLVLQSIRELVDAYGDDGTTSQEPKIVNFLVGAENFTSMWIPGNTFAANAQLRELRARLLNPSTVSAVPQIRRPLRQLTNLANNVVADQLCEFARPITCYSEDLDRAFQQYLQLVLGLTVVTLVTRWKANARLQVFADVQPSADDWCQPLVTKWSPNTAPYEALEDYMDFLVHLRLELAVQQYTEAKKTGSPKRAVGGAG